MTSLKSTLKGLTKAEKRYVLTRSYPLFAAYYFGLTIADFMRDMVKFTDEHQRSLILLPAGHTKTSSFGKFNLIRHICWNPNIRIILIMSVFDDASDYCKNVAVELTTNEKLIEDFGEFYSTSNWSASQFTVAQRQHNDPHPTLHVFGAGGKAPNWTIKGNGCDLIIADDVVTDDTAGSPDGRRRQSSWFRMAVQTCPRPMWQIDPRYGLDVPQGVDWPKDAPYNPKPGVSRYGQIIVPGTRFHPYDLYHELQDDKTYNELHFDCWAEKKNGVWITDKTETKPLWPGFWTNEMLHAERDSLKVINFNKRYRNNPMDDSEITFKDVFFAGDDDHPGCFDHDRSYGEIPTDDSGEKLDLSLVLGFDPASGEASKYAAFPTWVLPGFPRGGNPETDCRYIIDAYRNQIGVEGQLDVLLDGNPNIPHPGFYAKYHYDLAKVERNGFANLLLSHDRITRAKNRGVRIESCFTHRNKIDPIMGVQSMASSFANGLWRFPYKTDTDKKLTDEIVEQFVYFSFDRNGRRKSLTDYVMATWFSELEFRKSRNKLKAHIHPASRFIIQNPTRRRA